MSRRPSDPAMILRAVEQARHHANGATIESIHAATQPTPDDPPPYSLAHIRTLVCRWQQHGLLSATRRQGSTAYVYQLTHDGHLRLNGSPGPTDCQPGTSPAPSKTNHATIVIRDLNRENRQLHATVEAQAHRIKTLEARLARSQGAGGPV